MKKIILSALLATMTFVFVGGTQWVNANMNYKDVQTNHWAYSNIQEATKLGFLKGNHDGTFAPEKNVSKAEMAQLIARFFDEDKRVKEPFADLDNTHWATPAIEELLALNIINPNDYPNGKFEADKAMTRMEMAKWLTKALAIKQPAYKDFEEVIRTSQHTIIPVTEFYKGGLKRDDFGYAGIMLGTGMFTGYQDGSFQPNKNTVRSEVATLAIRLNNLLGKKPSSFTGLNEIVEVSVTATNMTSISPFIYIGSSTSFSDVTNKWAKFGTIGEMQFHHAIFIPNGSHEEEKKSIYGKMFKNGEGGYIEDTFSLFVHKTFKPNQTRQVKFLEFINATGNIFYASQSPHFKVAEKYNYSYLPNSDYNFVKDKKITYWSSFIQKTDWGNQFYLNDIDNFSYFPKSKLNW